MHMMSHFRPHHMSYVLNSYLLTYLSI